MVIERLRCNGCVFWGLHETIGAPRFFLSKYRIQLAYSILLDICLHVEIVLRHVYVCMSSQALDRFDAYTHGLKLRNVCMAATMRGEGPYVWNLFDSLFETSAKHAGIDDR